MTCTFHPDRDTLLGCTRCGRSACPDCLQDAPVGRHCPACVRGLPADQPLTASDIRLLLARSRREERARTGSRRPGWVFYLVVAVFLGLCAGAVALEVPVLTSEPVGRLVAVGVVVSGVVLSVTLHEYAHALTAWWGGDRSVAAKGYLTLDFRRYAHPLLSVGMPVLFLAIGALPLPGGAVLIEQHRLRSRAWSSIVSAAGVVTNAAFALVLAAVLATGVLDGSLVLQSLLSYLVVIQVTLVLLNLLPLPGLDGYGVVEPFLPRPLAASLEAVRPYGLVLLVVLMFSGGLDFVWQAGFAVGDLLGIDRTLVGVGAAVATLR
ncbi:site-2 protease family protein [Nocardioides zeicaulis]|uniref:Site-2 protease family protein n=1 Tax=Nocardioides zeicaulis TaxID=1776857 RepID=A0ABV6E696_9ACTN